MTTELEPRPAMASRGAQSSSVAWTAQTRASVRVEHADSEQRRCPCGIDHGGSIGCCKLHCARPRMAAREAPAWRARMHTFNCGTARAASANDSVATRGIRLRAPIRRYAHRLTGEAGARSGHAPDVVEKVFNPRLCKRLHDRRSRIHQHILSGRSHGFGAQMHARHWPPRPDAQRWSLVPVPRRARRSEYSERSARSTTAASASPSCRSAVPRVNWIGASAAAAR